MAAKGKAKKGQVRRRMDAFEAMASGEEPKARVTKKVVKGYKHGGPVACRANRS